MRFLPRSSREVFLVATAFLSSGSVLNSQAVLSGVVRHDSTGRALAGVEVIVEESGRQTTTNHSGQFVLGNLPFGAQAVLFRLIGFRPVRRGVILLRGDTARLEVAMLPEGAQRLEPMEVTTRPEPPRGMGTFESFEERRRLGFGKFIDSTVLRANEHRRVGDLLRGIPGLELVWFRECQGSNTRSGCAPPVLRARSTRTARSQDLTKRPCWATILQDGALLYRSESPSPPPDFSKDFWVNELEAIEVYRSAGEIPAEFGGIVGNCGLIVLWTRRVR